jgi:hypothetical protein
VFNAICKGQLLEDILDETTLFEYVKTLDHFLAVDAEALGIYTPEYSPERHLFGFELEKMYDSVDSLGRTFGTSKHTCDFSD